MKSAMWSVLCRTFYLQLDQEIILYQERIRTKEKAAETELLDLVAPVMFIIMKGNKE